MISQTVADHMGQSLFVPHPAPLMRFDNTTFPTPAAYDDVPFSADDYFHVGSFFHCSMIEQLAPPTSILNLQQQLLNFNSLRTTALAMTLDHTPSIMDSVTCICSQPWVFGFANCYYVQHVLATNGSLFDSGANICITHAHGLFVDVVDIPPFTFFIG
jgi:hypothetical protein